MATHDIFADALKSKLLELQSGITALHLCAVKKEHEELTREVAELRNENRCLHERVSHERVNWKGTKALRQQDHQEDVFNSTGDDSPGENSAQMGSEPAAVVNQSNDRPLQCEEDLCLNAPSSISSPQQATAGSCKTLDCQISHPLTSILPESKVGTSSSGEGSSALAESSACSANKKQRPRQASVDSNNSEVKGSEVPQQECHGLERSEPVQQPRWESARGSGLTVIETAQLPRQESGRLSAGLGIVEPDFGRKISNGSRGIYSDSGMSGIMQHMPSGGTKIFSNVMEALPVWQISYEAIQRETNRQSHISDLSFGSRPEDFHFYESEEEKHDMHSMDKYFAVITVQPLSTKRIFWDMVSFIFIAWDMFFIPLKLFNPPDWQFLVIMLWVTRLFWTLDLPISFLTGLLMKDGNIEMHPYRIARRYVRTWLFPDIAMVTCDWVELFVDVNVNVPWRLIKLLRLYRLTRILKIPETLSLIGERIWSEQVLLVANFVQIVGLVLGVAHLIACFWYGVSQIKSNGDSNWVYQHGFHTEAMFEQYAMSFHWSLTQFVGGMDIVQPYNIWERIFAILVVLLTFVISAAVVSSITSSMTRLQFIAGHRSSQLSSLRKYLMDHRISRKLMMRIQRNAEHAMIEKQRNIPESQVELLQLISEPLRVELHFEEHSPILGCHPFFELYTDVCPAGMRKICHHAVTTKVLWPGDVLFSNGETPTFPQMYFVCNGTLTYQPYVSRADEQSRIKVLPGHWACEGVLWVRWIHRGMLRVHSESRMVTVSASCFQEITCQVANGFHPGFYAMEFVEHLARAGQVSDVGQRDEVELIMQNAYERLLAMRQNRQMNKMSQQTTSGNRRRSTMVSKSDMRRSMRADSFNYDSNPSMLTKARKTALFVGDKMQEVVDIARSSWVPARLRTSRVTRIESPEDSDKPSRSGNPNSFSCPVPLPISNSDGASRSGSISSSSNSSNTMENGNTESPVNTDSDDAVETFSGRYSLTVTNAEPKYPSGEPVTLAVEEISDAH